MEIALASLKEHRDPIPEALKSRAEGQARLYREERERERERERESEQTELCIP